MIADLRGTNRRTIAKTLRSTGAATFVQYVSSFVLAPIVFAIDGAATFGAWATVSSILAVGALADAGLRLEISRRVAEAAGNGDPGRMQRAVREGTSLLAYVALAVLAGGCLLAPVVRSFAFPSGLLDLSAGEADLLLRATFALLAFSLLTDGYFAVLRGVQRSDIEANGRLVGTVLGTGAAIVGLQLGWGIWALLAGAVVMDLSAVLVQVVGTRRVVPEMQFRVCSLRGSGWRSLLAFSSLALLSQLSDVVDSQWDKIVLSRYVGSTAVASFQLGTTLALQAKTLALLPIAPLLVAIAELRHRYPGRVARLLATLSSATYALGALTLSGVVVFAPALLRLWIDTDLPQAVVSARMFSVAVAINLVAAPLAYRALAEGRHRLTAIASGCNIGVNAIASYLLTLLIGFRGPLWGSIAGNLCGTLVFFALMSRREHRVFTRGWRSVLIGIAAVAVALGTGAGGIATWPVLAIAVVCYSATVGTLLCWAERLPVRELLRRDLAAMR